MAMLMTVMFGVPSMAEERLSLPDTSAPDTTLYEVKDRSNYTRRKAG